VSLQLEKAIGHWKEEEEIWKDTEERRKEAASAE
jgi:hypothetical protein